jgi:hexosaminidase
MKRILLVFLIAGFSFSAMAQNAYNLIPVPKQLTPAEGSFTIKKGTGIAIGDEAFRAVADMLAAQCQTASGIVLPVKTGKASSGIVFIMNSALGEEAYALNVTSKKIELQAKTGKGAFYALQTLMQLMPAQIHGKDLLATALTIPNCSIADEPRFSYRGLMLDVGRHYYPVDHIKRFIDLMAMYKMNIFHWHLTEDQGWRIEIKKYPLLTKISSIRKESTVGRYSDKKFDGKPFGGFYTQE